MPPAFKTLLYRLLSRLISDSYGPYTRDRLNRMVDPGHRDTAGGWLRDRATLAVEGQEFRIAGAPLKRST